MNIRTIITGILIALALAAFLAKDILIEKGSDILFSGQKYEEETLDIVLNEPATGISPYNLNLNNLIRTANIYQGLVGFDRNLKIIPQLALSWGNLDDYTWEFKLREGVKFHDRSDFNANSVVESLSYARATSSAGIASYINNIKEIKVIDDYNIQIITEDPDPLLLSKLTKFFINRPGNVGTGPYKVKDWNQGKALELIAFTDYWGKQPAYRNVSYTVTTSKTQREKDFDNGKTEILASVTQDQALELPESQVKTSYSLEVNFLMFNMQNEIFSDREVRENIKTLFNPEEIEAIGNYFVRQASQFLAPGVYGYNSDIEVFEYDPENVKTNIFGDNKLERISLDYLSSYTTLIEYIQKPLKEAGFSLKLNSLGGTDLIDKIQNNQTDIFLIGWQAENGDAGGFLDAFIHSEGEFNNGRYVNEEMDELIEEARKEMNIQKRLDLLQNIVKKVDEELIGIPLFESSRLYAVNEDVNWEPRLDGLIIASEVK